MYSLDINFLKERAADGAAAVAVADQQGAAAPSINWTPAIAGGAVGLAFIAGVFVIGQQIDRRIAELDNEVADLTEELAQLQASRAEIQEKQATLETQKELTQALADIFEKVKPTTAVLQDLADRLPQGVQIDSLVQRGQRPNVELVLTGIAASSEALTYFTLALEESPLLEPGTTRLGTISQVGYPGGRIEGVPEGLSPAPVVRYSLTTQLNDRSALELLPVLQRKGADGLVARIQALRDRGLIELTDDEIEIETEIETEEAVLEPS